MVSNDGRTWVLFSAYAISGMVSAYDIIWIDELGVFCMAGKNKKGIYSVASDGIAPSGFPNNT